jgi:hypothetical protein
MVSVEQAAANALQAYLQTALGSGVKVRNRWPNPDKNLPPLAVTILLAGDPTRSWVQPHDISSQSGTSLGKRLYRWLVCESSQPLQIDCWATANAPALDDLRGRVDAALMAGDQRDTFPVPGPVTLSLLTADGWTGTADFFFDGFTVLQTPDTEQENEFRALCRGEARVAIYADAETPRLARIILQQTLAGVIRPADVVTDD